MRKMALESPSLKTSIDLSNINNFEGATIPIEILIKTRKLLYFHFKPDEVGKWNLKLEGISYSMTTLASCSFSFLPSFRALQLNSSHPSLAKQSGRPIANSRPILMISLAGKHDDVTVEKISFVDVKGNVLETHSLEDFTRSLITRSSLPGSPEQGEDLIIPTRYADGVGLTKTSFHIRLEGRDSQGEFHRLHPPLISPVTPRVEVTAQ